ncbi:MAG: AAA family ATPase, partial [Oscillospiraceae bacterium]|nr:AAA family ATPase [Oscillospiraceae bacterium]
TFVWGARQVGKTTLIREAYPDAVFYDLLLAKDFERLLRNPSLLGEDLATFNDSKTVVIDEIQKIPQLLDEVHSLIFHKNIRFILSGSSPRKLKRHGANLLGGRALKEILYPLISAEIPDFDIHKAVRYAAIQFQKISFTSFSFLFVKAIKSLSVYFSFYGFLVLQQVDFYN